MPIALLPAVLAAWLLILSICNQRALAQELPPDIASRPERVCILPDIPEQGDVGIQSVWATNLWPGGIVPYEFNPNVIAANRTAMRQAMDTLEAAANVRFIARTSQANHIYIQDSTGNSSQVGMVGGRQNINIYNWNIRFVICHELMHALGIWHEQQRPDRSAFVLVNYANIQPGYSSQYDIQSAAGTFGTFDFESVMCYGSCDLSTCCPTGSTCVCVSTCRTITVQPAYAQYQNIIGQRNRLSAGDIAGLINRYGAIPCPVITLQPVGQSLQIGQSVTLSVTATNGAYRWRRGQVNLTDDGRIAGAGTPVLTINGITPADQGSYDCVVSNSCGSVTSTPVTLAVGYSTDWAQLETNGPASRLRHAIAFSGHNSQTTLFGGFDGAALRSDTWTWDGATWTQATVNGPTARQFHAMAYDSARRVVVLYGGDTGATPSGETWEWNGTSWVLRATSGPPALSGHALAYDSSRAVTVLFGGTKSDGTFNPQTWEWNGQAWTLRSSTGPTARASHAMTFDSGRRVCVLFGGQTAAGDSAETWEWNGTAWTQRAVGSPGPSARRLHAMAYDGLRQVSVLFGGQASGATNAQTWEWTGSAWTQRSVTGPTARWGHAMTHDSYRGVTIVHGGTVGMPVRDTWGLLGACISPTISSHPATQVGCAGGTVTLTVVANGTGPFTYAWRKNGVAILSFVNPTALTDTLTLSGLQASSTGDYSCRVSNDCGAQISLAASVSIVGTRCGPADIADGLGTPLPPFSPCSPNFFNPGVDGGDFDCFFNYYFEPAPVNAVCDIADGVGDPLPPYGNGNGNGFNPGVDGGDFDCFFNYYFNGCP